MSGCFFGADFTSVENGVGLLFNFLAVMLGILYRLLVLDRQDDVLATSRRVLHMTRYSYPGMADPIESRIPTPRSNRRDSIGSRCCPHETLPVHHARTRDQMTVVRCRLNK